MTRYPLHPLRGRLSCNFHCAHTPLRNYSILRRDHAQRVFSRSGEFYFLGSCFQWHKEHIGRAVILIFSKKKPDNFLIKSSEFIERNGPITAPKNGTQLRSRKRNTTRCVFFFDRQQGSKSSMNGKNHHLHQKKRGAVDDTMASKSAVSGWRRPRPLLSAAGNSPTSSVANRSVLDVSRPTASRRGSGKMKTHGRENSSQGRNSGDIIRTPR